MSAKELSNEKNIVSVEITVSAEDFQKAIKQSYNKNKKHFTIQGFRKLTTVRVYSMKTPLISRFQVPTKTRWRN